jgi:hypothetical protein
VATHWEKSKPSSFGAGAAGGGVNETSSGAGAGASPSFGASSFMRTAVMARLRRWEGTFRGQFDARTPRASAQAACRRVVAYLAVPIMTGWRSACGRREDGSGVSGCGAPTHVTAGRRRWGAHRSRRREAARELEEAEEADDRAERTHSEDDLL